MKGLASGAPLPGVRKLAVLRANNIGDFVLALPALEALRNAYPDAELVLLGTPMHVELLSGRPGPVDRVEIVPPYRGVREPNGLPEDREEQEAFFERMRRERFDLAVQIHGGGRNSNPFLNRLGARVTAGLRTPDAAPLDLWVPYVYYQPEVLRYLEVVSLVGGRTDRPSPHLEVTEADLAASRSAVSSSCEPLAILHPGASDPRRWWPPEKFAVVGDVLARAGVRVVVTGLAGEEGLCRAIVDRMSSEAISACGRTSLPALLGLLSRAQLVVASDSGPRHLAEALGTPTVGIYWCGNALLSGPITRTLHRPAISWRTHCPVCGASCIREWCEHRESFVADVSVDEVVGSALDLLGARDRAVRAAQEG